MKLFAACAVLVTTIGCGGGGSSGGGGAGSSAPIEMEAGLTAGSSGESDGQPDSGQPNFEPTGNDSPAMMTASLGGGSSGGSGSSSRGGSGSSSGSGASVGAPTPSAPTRGGSSGGGGSSAGSGSSTGGGTATSGGSSPSRTFTGTVSFELGPSAERVDRVQLYVGSSSGNYDRQFFLDPVSLRGTRGTAMERMLATILNSPGVYFVALTVIDTAGRESGFSNEIRVDTRVRRAALIDVFGPPIVQQWAMFATASSFGSDEPNILWMES